MTNSKKELSRLGALSAAATDARNDKNSSGDEIANVNVFTTISHTCFKIPKKENLLRLTN